LFGPIRGQTKNNKEYKRISTAALKAQKLGGKPSSIQLSILAKAKSGRRMGLFILLKCRVLSFNLHLKKSIYWEPTKICKPIALLSIWFIFQNNFDSNIKNQVLLK